MQAQLKPVRRPRPTETGEGHRLKGPEILSANPGEKITKSTGDFFDIFFPRD